jgi:hypothetical protein
MADINVGEIPRFRGPFPENVARAIRGDGRQKLRRRTVLKGTIVAAGALGLSAIGWLPTARRAWGHHGASYDIKALPCPTYDFYDSNPPCGKPCGPSTIYPDACVDTQSFHYWGYHKDGSGSQNWDLRPGQCSGTFDGWIWRVEQTCGVGACNDWIKYRCHDGWATDNAGHHIDKSICKFWCDCGGSDRDECVTD